MVYIFDKLIEQAQHSNMLHTHSAVVFKNGKPILYGHNETRGFTNIHAEMNVIRKYCNQLGIYSYYNIKKLRRILRKIEILVVRIAATHPTQYLRMSKPCYHCIQQLRYLGIKKIYYSNEMGDIIYEKMNHIHNAHITPLYKNKYSYIIK